MRHDQNDHHRRSIRLKEYDYSQEGAYFITVCTRNHECVFGDIVNGEMVLNKFGQIVFNEWMKTKTIRQNIELDEFVIMPNHFHGIIIIVDECTWHCRGVARNAPTTNNVTHNVMSKISPLAGSLPTIIRSFKSAVSKCCHENCNKYFAWQRNYYEHVIRNEYELNIIREYIINNPLQWELDENYI